MGLVEYNKGSRLSLRSGEPYLGEQSLSEPQKLVRSDHCRRKEEPCRESSKGPSEGWEAILCTRDALSKGRLRVWQHQSYR